MDVVFPKIPLYEGWGRPLRAETTVTGLELVAGHVPESLVGSFYRAGPDRQFPPSDGDDVFIDGEGMVHAFRFDADGLVSYRSRWVRTERFIAQERAGRSLFGRYRNRHTALPEARGLHPGAANTTAFFHAGQLTVLKEDDLPYAVDPLTLETLGRTDLGGQVTASCLAAHPKIDAATGECLTFANQARGDASRDVALYAFGPDGRKRQENWFQAPSAGVVHDFGITDEHCVLPFFPLITDAKVLEAGGPFYQWHPDTPFRVAVLPRDGRGEPRWFEGPKNFSAGHMMNAFQEGTQVHLDVAMYDGNCFPFFPTPDGRTIGSGPPLLTRLTMDLADARGAIRMAPLMRRPGELPRTDDRVQGRPYRYGYEVSRSPDGFATIVRIDVTTGAMDAWNHGQPVSVHEPQFVPRHPGAAEGDGWLLVVLNRLDQGHSELAIFDAMDLAGGPVARLHLPVRVRSTFHGCWVPG